jgi:hypothetical protein
MEDQTFDDLIKQLGTTRLTRLSALRGLAAGAAAAVAGAALVSDGEAKKHAKKKSKKSKKAKTTSGGATSGGATGDVAAQPSLTAQQEVKACPAGARQTRHLGEACGSTNCCVASENLECQKVAETGAFRCECKTGFVACDDQCVAISCPGGSALNTTTCECECPDGTVTCDNGACVSDECPIDGQTVNLETCRCECGEDEELCGGECVSNVCTGGQVFNPSTCACGCPSPCPSTEQTQNPTTCACSCPTNQVFCGGHCHNPATTCEGLHNKIFDVDCCNQGVNPCQNPGQPSGKCKA